ncbi:hypothetical protein GGR57DRAFT_111140 [Xylariaceae sp. FL1272]|nr:hypothetical protein GGR57DRAFT_111140 [Xylariaceae sp. FL1272]
MPTSLFFRIAYNSIYAFLCLILGILLLVVPADFTLQALRTTHQVINLIVIGIIYALTVIIVLFVYALRLYVTRSVLAGIPRAWLPVKKGDVTNDVNDMIVVSLSRSAAIALEARPKVMAPDLIPSDTASVADREQSEIPEESDRRRSRQLFRSKPPVTVEDQMGIALPSVRPVWGHIEHSGWGSPASPDLANLQYTTVISELPNLIEAKAVSLAPSDPEADPLSEAPTLNADALELLQRLPTMTMRQYIQHLTELEVLSESEELSEFLRLYEQDRFSGRPMPNATFRELMHLFAEVLRSMQPLDPSVLYEGQGHDPSYFGFDGHIDDDAPQDSAPTTPTRSIASSFSITRPHSQRRQSRLGFGHRNSSANTRNQYGTAPTTPKSKAGGTMASRSLSASSGNSFAQSRRPYPASLSSSSSMRSVSQGSVIRLATAQDPGDLPYVLRLTDSL